jgi:solute carrier family 25 (mitochondrial carnitine/acylcarnitine transporter), member 20/29
MVKGEMDQAKSFIAGGFAGVSNVLAGHPFDTLKVRLQTSNQYKGLADCFRQTIAKDGLISLYRGIGAPLVGVTPMFALSFWSYEVGQQLVKASKNNSAAAEFTMLDYALAGGFSAIPTTVITTPMER